MATARYSLGFINPVDGVTIPCRSASGSVANTTRYRSLRPTSRAMAYGLEGSMRSEEHTSELQSRLHLVCRLLLEKKKIETLKYLAASRNAHHMQTARDAATER